MMGIGEIQTAVPGESFRLATGARSTTGGQTMTSGTDDAAPAPADTNDSALQRQLFGRLDRSIDELWTHASNSEFWQHVLTRGFDRELYRIAMTQVYHYTRHNSLNQAVAAFGADPDDIGLLRFVYGHANEELGPEMMVPHDLRELG